VNLKDLPELTGVAASHGHRIFGNPAKNRGEAAAIAAMENVGVVRHLYEVPNVQEIPVATCSRPMSSTTIACQHVGR